MSRSLEGLGRSLGYRFQDAGLLQSAVTHRSAGSGNNERLEFLGDAVLGFVVAEWLYTLFPQASEGQLSRLRASLVKKETLAGIARELNIGDYLRLGSGELKSGGFRRDSILADALEAILGGIVMDSGFEACRSTIHHLFADRVGRLSAGDELKDPKTRLQEYLQSRKLALPEYEVVDVSGQAHRQQFVVECRVTDVQQSVRGTGSSRRRAEQTAAETMLAQLQAGSVNE
ncbi:MAG TPA: ribonuclease III [Gammaproteobacteria bacterium]|nr:ribonuclease III [Gammaproteobacteria bacterium]